MHLSHLLKQPRIFSILLVCCVVLPQNSRAQDQAPQFERSTLIAAAQEIMLAARYCTLVTLDASGQPHVRTMDPFEPESDMVVRLGTFRNSRKVGDIQNDPRVALHYLSPSGSGYVSISGTARLVDDPAEKARYWKSEWEPFYSDKENDYLLIVVQPSTLEVIDFSKGIASDPITWMAPTVTW